MAQAQEGNTVKVHYTGKLEDGTVFDSSTGRAPLEFTLGEGELIPGFEEAVDGMEPGETKTTEIAPEDAYGPYDQDLVFQIERSRFPDEIDPEVGQQLQLRQEDGQAFQATIMDVTDDAVTMDANHPLAGKDLTFDIELVEIVE